MCGTADSVHGSDLRCFDPPCDVPNLETPYGMGGSGFPEAAGLSLNMRKATAKVTDTKYL